MLEQDIVQLVKYVKEYCKYQQFAVSPKLTTDKQNWTLLKHSCLETCKQLDSVYSTCFKPVVNKLTTIDDAFNYLCMLTIYLIF